MNVELIESKPVIEVELISIDAAIEAEKQNSLKLGKHTLILDFLLDEKRRGGEWHVVNL